MSGTRTPFRITLATLAVLAATPLHAYARPAPAFAVKTLDGKPLRLADLKKKPVIVDFWATWCGPCRASMPHLSTMQSRYGKQGLTVIGMSVDENGTQGVKRFAQQLGVKFTLAMANDD